MSKELPTCFKQIQAFTHAKRLTQKDLMDAGKVSRTAANHYFHGEHEPRYGTLQQWGVMFGLNMNWLFYGDGPIFQDSPIPYVYNRADAAGALQGQMTHLRLVNDRNHQEESQGPACLCKTKEVVMQKRDKDAFEAQIRLIDHVCKTLAENGASQDTIQRAVLALVSGAF